MARKDRAPNPPKRPQAPQRRSTPTDPAASARQRRLLAVIAGSGIVVLTIVLAIIFFTPGGESGERAALEDAGCTLESFPAMPNKSDHSDVPTETTEPKWNSSPPTSGPHYGEWAIWGSYGPGEAVPLAKSTHNLEHGGVVIHYGPDVPEAEVDELRTWFNETDDPNALLISPLAANDDKITLSAWTAPDATTGTNDRGNGWLAICKTFDEGAVSAFLDAHRYQGPERVPRENLAPGTS